MQSMRLEYFACFVINMINLNEIKNFFTGFIEILYPKICEGCKSLSSNILCNNCKDNIIYTPSYGCSICGRVVTSFKCDDCLNNQIYYKKCKTIVKYKDIIVTLVHMFKYNKREDIGDYIIKEMIDRFPYENVKFDYISNVPMHSIRHLLRNFDHSRYLAKGISKQKNIPYKTFIKKTKYIKSQTKFSHEDRFNNILNSFRLITKDNLKGKNILIIDDVITTGATLNEYAKILSKTQANIYLLVYADARK